MQRFVLFSQFEKNPHKEEILNQMFPPHLTQPKVAFIPSNGLSQCAPKYLKFWRKVAKRRNLTLSIVDIGEDCKFPTIEKHKILNADVVVISGGNTLELARLIKKWKLTQTFTKFIQKKHFILAGYSAGAIILTPRLDILKAIHKEQENRGNSYEYQEIVDRVEIFSGLGFLDFEVFPHYNEKSDAERLQKYKDSCPNQVKAISNTDYLIIEKSTHC